MAWVASLGIHGLAIAAWLGFVATPPDPAPRSRLDLELFGLVSQRQVQAQAPSKAQPPPPTPPALSEPAVRPPAPPRLAPQPLVRRPSRPAPRADADPVQVADASPAVPQDAPPAAPPPPVEALPRPDARQAEAVRPVEDEQIAIGRYVAALGRTLQRHLVYPPRARESGATGSPLIAFTVAEDGSLVPDTVRIHRSSGHPVLDEAAVQLARDSGPFARPPRRIGVVVAISFAEQH
ncbi:TonB family protein [Pseudorhodoferax soli]|uniref:Outer membrane transport energization protein TonB n=1 Tax=Pseudorhodoferax soli TaxID=545864 RepID=A0A368XKF4_9BURK|nr:TonB family protein [Pseudorhodoferax soli]RCW68511.1 outer membrane transport energization protein TonB [Pseudorhodoferax soli]